MRENLLKENKENANINNIQHNKIGKLKELPACQVPKLEHKVSETTTATITHNLLKKDSHGEQLKKTYSLLAANDYSADIMNYLCVNSASSHGFLTKHAITPNLRSKMIDWMIEVLSSYKMTE